MSAGSCWSQQNSIDINDSRRPSEDCPLPMMHHHLHAIFKEHQIMSPIKEISSSSHQHQNISDPVHLEEVIDQLTHDRNKSSERFSKRELSPESESTNSISQGSVKQISKEKLEYTTERAHSSASLISQSQTNVVEERRASLSLLITCNKQQNHQSNRLSPQHFSHAIPGGQGNGKSKTRPSSPKKYIINPSRCDSLSKLNNNHGTMVGSQGPPLTVHYPSNRYRTAIVIGKKSHPSTGLSTSSLANIPGTGNMGASSRRSQWRRMRPMSLDTVLMKKEGNKPIMEEEASSAITEQW